MDFYDRNDILNMAEFSLPDKFEYSTSVSFNMISRKRVLDIKYDKLVFSVDIRCFGCRKKDHCELLCSELSHSGRAVKRCEMFTWYFTGNLKAKGERTELLIEIMNHLPQFESRNKGDIRFRFQ